MTTRRRFASGIDASVYGPAPVPRTDVDPQPFAGRLSNHSSGRYRAQAGRYHLYGGWSCPRTHRAAIAVRLCGLDDAVSVSYVDGMRDGRGWAFRERTGADPINGFTLIREVCETSRPGYLGYASIPVLWDRVRREIVTNVADDMDRDLASAFADVARPGPQLYPEAVRGEIDTLSGAADSLWRSMACAVYDAGQRDVVHDRLRELNARFVATRYLIGDALTLADIRLWVLLVRYDAGINAHGRAGPLLRELPHLWAYACRLYAIPAFSSTTDFAAFSAPPMSAADWLETWKDGALGYGAPAGYAATSVLC